MQKLKDRKKIFTSRTFFYSAALVFVFSVGILLGKQRAETEFQKERFSMLKMAQTPREPASTVELPKEPPKEVAKELPKETPKESSKELVDGIESIRKLVDLQTKQLWLIRQACSVKVTTPENKNTKNEERR